MALPENPVSGGYELSNSAGRDDHWSCPACYEDHTGCLQDTTVICSCGATLKLEIDHEPVCRATCIDPDMQEDS